MRRHLCKACVQGQSSASLAVEGSAVHKASSAPRPLQCSFHLEVTALHPGHCLIFKRCRFGCQTSTDVMAALVLSGVHCGKMTQLPTRREAPPGSGRFSDQSHRAGNHFCVYAGLFLQGVAGENLHPHDLSQKGESLTERTVQEERHKSEDSLGSIVSP